MFHDGEKTPSDLGHNREIKIRLPRLITIEATQDELRELIQNAEKSPKGASESPVTTAQRYAEYFGPTAGQVSTDDKIGELARLMA